MIDLKIVCGDDKYLPTYANETDACMDLKIKVSGNSGYVLLPNQIKTFRTGVKVAIPEDHVMLVFPRSSTGCKLNCALANSTGIIDSGYRDEIKLVIHNFGDKSQILEDGQRIAQFMIIPRPKVNLTIVPDDDEFKLGDRGGGFGSTGKC